MFTYNLGNFLIAEEFFLFCIENSALVRNEFELDLFFYAIVLTELKVLECIGLQGKYL